MSTIFNDFNEFLDEFNEKFRQPKITISGQKSKELLSKLIRNEFDKKHDFYSNRPFELIRLAKECGLNELVNEMKKDL